MDLKSVVRTIPNYPIEGVMFRDITTILQNPDALNQAINDIIDQVKDLDFDYVVGPESRGFIFGVPVAYALKKGFIPIRKPGKLPAETISVEYSLEYGTGTLEMHKDALKPGDKVVVIDDLIATGGTTVGICKLIESAGAEVVSMNFVIELDDLGGRKALEGYNIQSLLHYEGE